jgi:hypothetical protein
MTDPIHNYTQGAWQGENYESGLDIKEIAKRLRKHLKNNHPDFKFSVRIERYSGGQSMSIEMMSAPFKPIIESISEEWQDGNRVVVHKPVEEQYAQLNHHCLDDYKAEQSFVRNNGYVLDDRVIPVLKSAVSFAQGYNYDDSDSMIDYFNTNFYIHLGIGKWDRPCEYPKTLTEIDDAFVKQVEDSLKSKVPESNVPASTVRDDGYSMAEFESLWTRLVDESAVEENYCENCGQHFANHNDDGSCVDDEEYTIVDWLEGDPDDELSDEELNLKITGNKEGVHPWNYTI